MQPDSDRTVVVAIEPPSASWPFMLALLATAVALGGALAHALELPNKIGLDRDAYFTVQQIYRGWARARGCREGEVGAGDFTALQAAGSPAQ